jgi:repressor LexA
MVAQRQREVLEFIRSYSRAKGAGPTVREIQGHFRFASPNAAQCHLVALRRKGMLQKSSRRWRGVRLANGEDGLPVFGTIPAGNPMAAYEEVQEYIPCNQSSFGVAPNAIVFALRVKGESMKGAGIFSGDIVVVVQRQARNGDIVAALIDGESTLKRLVMKRGRPYLHAENPKFADRTPSTDLQIQGVVVGLIRRDVENDRRTYDK